jgi:hypothetical protein
MTDVLSVYHPFSLIVRRTIISTQPKEGWPCNYCGELDPDFQSVCSKCYEIHIQEIREQASLIMGHPVSRKRTKRN